MADLMQNAIKRRVGRPHKAERMNLLVDDIEDVAEAAKLKFMSGGLWELHVDDKGNVAMAIVGIPAPEPRPAHWLVGAYTGRVPVPDLEADLMARLAEIMKLRRMAG